MSQFFVTEEGGLTGAGYGIFAIAGAAFIMLAAILASKAGKPRGKTMMARELVFCAAAIALAFLTSYIRILKMPWGGYWYGVKTGIMAGLAYGILQFLQEPYVLSGFQVCCDYIFAFAALGLSGLFMNAKNGLVKGYLLGALMRGAFHALGGYLYWMEYMPENFPKALEKLYPVAYNYYYIGAEAVITMVILGLPAVKNAMERVRRIARE